ncbi:MAG: bifunctional phosphoglucose/phosphomannose isomerase [Bacteroidota bacterium]
MKTLISNFSKQLEEAIDIGKNAQLSRPVNEITNVLISGLGGSGIGGSIVSEIVENEASVPINVNKDYFIPQYVDQHTLMIISSYSGNTEETISAMNLAGNKNAEIVCITSGGEVLDTAKKNNLNYIVIPGGMPPRACLGYSMTQLLYILHHFGIIGNSFKTDIEASIKLLYEEEENIIKQAKSIAQRLFNKIPIIYSTASNAGVAVRFRQQLNENAKMLCWTNVLPEMNHNELVGWRKKNEELAIVIFRNDTDFSRTQKRIEICKDIFAKYTSTIIEIYSRGNSHIEKAIYLIHLGDWASFFLSELNKVDVMEIEVINYLKSELAKIS